jgi:hypothetical protein
MTTVLSRTPRGAGCWRRARSVGSVDDAAAVPVPRLSELDAVVLGGDRHALDGLRADPRLAKLFALAQSRVLEVREPRRTVLGDAAVEMIVRDEE